MRVTEVRFTRRISDGNYGFIEAGLTTASDGADPSQAFALMRTEVDKQLGVKADAVVETPAPIVPVKPTKVEEPVKEKKTRRSSAEVKAEKEAKAAVKEEPKKEEPKKEKAKKKKEVKYDRDNLVHKKELSRLLDELHPQWRDKEIKPKAVKLSTDLVGEVLYEDGEVATSFIQLITEGM